MIPNRPPSRLREPAKWSESFVDFVSQCLVKDPKDRPTSRQLLEVRFIACVDE